MDAMKRGLGVSEVIDFVTGGYANLSRTLRIGTIAVVHISRMVSGTGANPPTT